MSAIRASRPYRAGTGVSLLSRFIVLVVFVVFLLAIERVSGPHLYWLCVLLVLQFTWSLWSWRRAAGSLFDPYGIFLIAAALFNGGKAILEVLHLNEYGIETFMSNDGYRIFSFSPDTIYRSLLLVLLGLGAFHLGALWAASRDAGEADGLSSVTSASTARRTGWVLLLISVMPMATVILKRLAVVSSSGYFGLFQRQAETGLANLPQALANLMVPGVLFLLSGSKGKRHLLVLSVLVILVYSVIQAFTGTRLWWAMPVVAFVWLWHCQVAPIPRVFLGIAAAGILFVVFPTLAVVRNIPGVERLALDFFVESYLSIRNPVVGIISEMGGTLLTIAHTLELIPMVRDFDWGLGYLYSVLTVFPNLFWEIHPTVARGLYSHWLTHVVNPAVFYAGGGYGFSFIAEAYANFGWVGTPLLLGLVGFLYARFVLWGLRSRDPARSATVAAFLAYFLIYARGESALVVRSLIWYVLFPYLLTRLFLRSR